MTMPTPAVAPDASPDTAPETAAATITISHEHAEVQEEERPATDSPGISGSDAGIPEEKIGQEPAEPSVTDPPLRHEMPGISEPATPAAAGDVFPEPPVSSSPEISRTCCIGSL